MIDTKPAAVVLSGYVTGLAAVRELAGEGVRVTVVPLSRSAIANRSRWVSEVGWPGCGESREALLDLLRRRAPEWAGHVLLPTSDPAVEILARHHEELSRSYRLATPPWEVTQWLFEKEKTYQAARRADVPLPHDYGPASPALLDAEIRYPVLLKPSTNLEFGQKLRRKILVAENRSELRDALNTLARHGLTAMAYDLIPGPDSAYYNYLTYIDRQGKEVAGLAIRKIRKAPSKYGVGRVATNEVDEARAEALRRLTLSLLRGIGWAGPASAEFKLDPRDGQFKLMEINGRQSLMMGIGPAAGVPFALLTWREAAEGAVQPVRPNGWRGCWIHGIHDIVYTFSFERRQFIGWKDFLAPYRGAKTWAVWSWRDPAPFFWQWALAIRSRLQRRWSRSA